MKHLLVLCIVVVTASAAALTDEQKHKLSEVHRRCQENTLTHIDDTIFEKLRNHEKVDLPSNFGAHELCMSKGVGLITADGTVDKEVLRKSLTHSGIEESKIDDIINQCSEVQETAEKTALNLRKCLVKHAVRDQLAHHGHDHHHSHN